MTLLPGVSLDILLAVSLHTSPLHYNAIHPAVRLESHGWVTGVYYNSVRRASVYAGRRYQSDRTWVEVGMVTGYQYAVVPMVRFGYQANGNLGVFVMPAFDEAGPMAVLGAEYRF